MRVAQPTEVRPDQGRRSRRTLAGCGVVLLLLSLLPTSYLWWANRPPTIPADTRVYPSPNGYDRLRAAAMKLTPSEPDSPLARPGQEDAEALRRALTAKAQERAALEEVRSALKLEYMSSPTSSLAEQFPHFSNYREAARRFAAESRVADDDGHGPEAAQSAIDAIELGSRSGRGGGIIHNLVGVACSAIGVSALERIESRLSAEEARAAGHRLDRVMRQFPRAPEVFREEKRAVLMGMDEIFSGDLDPAELAPEDAPAGEPVPGSSSSPAARKSIFFFYPKQLTYGALTSGFDRMVAEAGRPYVQRMQIEPPREFFAALLMPEFQPASLAFCRGETGVLLARGALAVKEFQARRARLPETLAELSQVTGVKFAADPFTGEPLRYRRTKNGYLLYSVGPDGIDDGGKPLAMRDAKPAARGDIVWSFLYPPRKEGR